MSTGLSEVLAYHRAGKLKIIAVSATLPVPELPELATFIEQGVDFSFVNWRGFFAAPGIPDSAADEYAALLKKMQATPEWEELRSRNGWQNLYLPRKDFVSFLQQQEKDIGGLMLELGFLRKDST